MTPLTEREMQVLLGMSYGRTNKAIGETYGLSEDTIKTFARRLFKKLGAVDRANAVRLAYETGLLTVPDKTVVTTPVSETYL